MDEKLIAVRLIEAAQSRGTLLSAQLGSVLAREFPEMRRDPNFPGLRRFVEAHCNGRIVPIGQQGGDIVYQYVPEGAHQPPSVALRSAVTPWDAFQHPNLDERVFVDRTTGALRVLEANAATPSAEFVEVPKLTPQEHQTIARTFLEHINAHDLPEAEAALASANYWPAWVKVVSKLPYKAKWAEFRFDRIRGLFRTRLQNLAVPEAAAAASINHLLAEKSERYRQSISRQAKGTAVPRRLGDSRARTLREIVHEVIETMSDSELRNLRLPLGDVLDALEDQNRK